MTSPDQATISAQNARYFVSQPTCAKKAEGPQHCQVDQKAGLGHPSKPEGFREKQIPRRKGFCPQLLIHPIMEVREYKTMVQNKYKNRISSEPLAARAPSSSEETLRRSPAPLNDPLETVKELHK